MSDERLAALERTVQHLVDIEELRALRRTPQGWRFVRMQFAPLFTLPFDESWVSEDRLKMGR